MTKSDNIKNFPLKIAVSAMQETLLSCMTASFQHITVNPRISPPGGILIFWILYGGLIEWGLIQEGGLFEKGAYSRGN